uniref:Uncharacterized protein n=1 Tax=Rhizophora mucronata TaxID=61149 RepID=A0A2P2N4I1_RHIMU
MRFSSKSDNVYCVRVSRSRLIMQMPSLTPGPCHKILMGG